MLDVSLSILILIIIFFPKGAGEMLALIVKGYHQERNKLSTDDSRTAGDTFTNFIMGLGVLALIGTFVVYVVT